MAPNESSDSVIAELKEQVAALQRQTFYLLLALLFASGTVTFYLYRQDSALGKQMTSLRPQADQVINTFLQNRSVITNFYTQVIIYGKTHPEVEQILVKDRFVAPPGH